MKKVIRFWGRFFEIVTFEWPLTGNEIPNGGSVIALRSLLISTLLFAMVLIILNILNPDKIYEFSYEVLYQQIVAKLSWWGVFFGFVYVALYARFSAQWTYLASLYNQIKAAELNGDNKDKIAEWKAGFIEDAEILHLLAKSTFANIVSNWGKEDIVRSKYIEFSPGGEVRYIKVMEIAEKGMKYEERKYYNKENKD